MTKPAIVAAILERLRADFEARRSASMSTRAAGNDSESRAESKYDTLSIEQNYLADGLARQARIAAQAAAAYEKLGLREFAPHEPADVGALVEIEFPGGVAEWFFLGPAAGGLELVREGAALTVITPESPLGRQLVGRAAGESLDAPKARIRSVR